VKRINIYGSIIPSSYSWYYDYFNEDYTSANNVNKTLTEANGEDIEVYINSPGGVIDVGSEIYTSLKAYKGNVKIYIVGQACSAASVISMARECYMSPTALMMVHCVSTRAGGNHSDMEKTAETLRIADDSLSNAYMLKSGMSKEETLQMMELETWLTANQAKDRGLIDGIMFEQAEPLRLTASDVSLPTEEMMDKVKNMINKQTPKLDESAFLIQKIKAQHKLLSLEGARI
jgi:ATP-dependent Clp endopeptidase proteolytic subunit ClpP